MRAKKLELKTWEAWNTIHQPFELDWWREALKAGHSQDDAGFAAQWAPVKEFIQPRGVIIDIGCGPRPPFAPCVVIEPLAQRYSEIVPREWWTGVTVYNQCAEILIPDLKGDTVICWNCIDHAIGWRQIIDNMCAYGNPGARFAIATDFHAPFTGHPGVPRDEFMDEIERRFTIVDRREPFGRHLALLLTQGGKDDC
jgi:hypothetical protein